MYPNVERQVSTTSAAATTHPVNLPIGIRANELLLLGFTVDGTATSITTPSGWTLLSSGQVQSGTAECAVFIKKATGGEGGTVSITVGASQQACAIASRISGWGGNLDDDVEVTTNVGFGVTPEGGNHLASWDSGDNLFATLICCEEDAVTGVTVSSSTGGNTGRALTVSHDNGTNMLAMGVDWRQQQQAAWDPSLFTTSPSTNLHFRWFTIAVKPGPAAIRPQSFGGNYAKFISAERAFVADSDQPAAEPITIPPDAEAVICLVTFWNGGTPDAPLLNGLAPDLVDYWGGGSTDNIICAIWEKDGGSWPGAGIETTIEVGSSANPSEGHSVLLMYVKDQDFSGGMNITNASVNGTASVTIAAPDDKHLIIGVNKLGSGVIPGIDQTADGWTHVLGGKALVVGERIHYRHGPKGGGPVTMTSTAASWFCNVSLLVVPPRVAPPLKTRPKEFLI